MSDPLGGIGATDTTEKPEEKDYAERLRGLSAKKEELTTRRARLQGTLEAAEGDLKRIEKEMADAGTSPDTIDDDLANLEKETEEAFAKCEEEMEKFEQEITEAEKALQKVSEVS